MSSMHGCNRDTECYGHSCKQQLLATTSRTRLPNVAVMVVCVNTRRQPLRVMRIAQYNRASSYRGTSRHPWKFRCATALYCAHHTAEAGPLGNSVPVSAGGHGSGPSSAYQRQPMVMSGIARPPLYRHIATKTSRTTCDK